jgi:hypothetical protein
LAAALAGGALAYAAAASALDPRILPRALAQARAAIPRRAAP